MIDGDHILGTCFAYIRRNLYMRPALKVRCALYAACTVEVYQVTLA